MRDNKRCPVLITIAGLNGSGKTSIMNKILNHEWLEDAIYINPDIIAQEKFGDWNSIEAVRQSIEDCESLRGHCLAAKARVTRRVLGGEHDAPISKIISRKLLILFLADIPYSARRRENERKREWWRTGKS